EREPAAMEARQTADHKRYAQAREKFEKITGWLDSMEAVKMTHSELEARLQADGRELMRQLLQDHVDCRQGGAAAERVVGADQEERTQVRARGRHLTTVFGKVLVHRFAYGGRQKTSLAPLDAELNLPPESYSFGLQRKL